MEVIVQLQKEVAAELRKAIPSASIAGDVTEVVQEFNVDLQPLHPSVRDAKLQTYFVINVPDKETGDEIALRLRNCKDIEAAYVKLPSEEPS